MSEQVCDRCGGTVYGGDRIFHESTYVAVTPSFTIRHSSLEDCVRYLASAIKEKKR